MIAAIKEFFDVARLRHENARLRAENADLRATMKRVDAALAQVLVL